MSQVRRVCDFLKRHPGEVLSTREIAIRLFSENPAIYIQKVVNLATTRPNTNVIVQIAAEINAQVHDIKRLDQNIVTDDTGVRTWVYIEKPLNIFKGRVFKAPIISKVLPLPINESLSILMKSVEALSGDLSTSDEDFELEKDSVGFHSKLLQVKVPGIIESLTEILQYANEVNETFKDFD